MDIHGRRLRLMDEFGMEMMILSLNAPAVQAIHDPKKANEIARKANDYLAEQVTKRPDRFQALAALPLQDPDMAAREMERCVKELGMVGALANGFSQIGDPNTIAYLDEKQYWPFWDVCDSSTCRSICIRAIRCRRTPASTRAPNGCSARSGRSATRPRCMRCG